MKEKLNNKTCKDCRYMLHKDTFEVCTLRMTETAMFDNACEHFTPPTVGDRIRQMSDEELAELLTSPPCDICCRRRYDSCGDINCREILLTTFKQEAKDGQ